MKTGKFGYPRLLVVSPIQSSAVKTLQVGNSKHEDELEGVQASQVSGFASDSDFSSRDEGTDLALSFD